jgi:hypothetical protein
VNSTRTRSSLIYLLLFIAIISLLVYNFNQAAPAQEIKTINEVAADIQGNKVDRIIEDDNRLKIIYKDGTRISYNLITLSSKSKPPAPG